MDWQIMEFTMAVNRYFDRQVFTRSVGANRHGYGSVELFAQWRGDKRSWLEEALIIQVETRGAVKLKSIGDGPPIRVFNRSRLSASTDSLCREVELRNHG